VILGIVLETLKQFNFDLKQILENKYLDIILYGSNSINSFTPNRWDIDFIVILDNDLNNSEIDKIFELHDNYRARKYRNLEHQLEGVYYPVKVLEKIDSNIVGCYIGTGRKGWEKITSFQNNYFDLIQIKNNGIYYRNKKCPIYEPKKKEINEFITLEIDKLIKLLDDNMVPSIVIIQFVARTLYYINHNQIGSKKTSCLEYSIKYNNNELIKKYGEINYPDNTMEVDKNFPEHKKIALESLNELKEIMEKGQNCI
jgi:hypothetical protein